MILLPLPPDLATEAAHYLAARLVTRANGPMRLPATWRQVAQDYGIRVVEFFVPGGGRGEFVATPPDGEAATIAINTAYAPRLVAAAYIHEITEVLIRRMVVPSLPSGSDAGYYEGDPANVQHDVARRVEWLILGE